jgi:hypothetical protein
VIKQALEEKQKSRAKNNSEKSNNNAAAQPSQTAIAQSGSATGNTA